MRAIAVFNSDDSPELIELAEPAPGHGEILVALDAASINPIDLGIASGHFEGRRLHARPVVLGVDGVGRVVETGAGVHGIRTGDVVHGQFLGSPLGRGTFAEFAVTAEHPDDGAIQRVPESLSTTAAAALPTAGMTALGAIDAMGLAPGQSLLIVGATGGVGAIAVQLAAARGIEVLATARPEAERWIRDLGADVTIDYSRSTVVDEMRRIRHSGVDAVLDLTRDPRGFEARTALVVDGGVAVTVTSTASPELLASERIRMIDFTMREKADLLDRITAEAVSGRITVPVHRSIALDAVVGALRDAAAGGTRGKTVVRITEQEK